VKPSPQSQPRSSRPQIEKIEIRFQLNLKVMTSVHQVGQDALWMWTEARLESSSVTSFKHARISIEIPLLLLVCWTLLSYHPLLLLQQISANHAAPKHHLTSSLDGCLVSSDTSSFGDETRRSSNHAECY